MIGLRVLSTHGVGRTDISSLMRWFGPAFPRGVETPEDVLLWSIAMLPWSYKAPIIQRWLARGFERAGLDNDKLALRVVDVCVAEPTVRRALKVSREITAIVEAMLDDLGVDDDEELTSDREDLTPVFRVWAASSAALHGVRSAAYKQDAHSTFGTSLAVFQWLASLEPEAQSIRMLDSAICEMTAALVKFTGSWSPGPAAKA